MQSVINTGNFEIKNRFLNALLFAKLDNDFKSWKIRSVNKALKAAVEAVGEYTFCNNN